MAKAKYDAIRIAKQLCYKADVIERIKAAKTENEILRILHDARQDVRN